MEQALGGAAIEVVAKANCWDGEHVLFAESKRRRRASHPPGARAFQETALAAGYHVEDFLIVEWDMAPGTTAAEP